MKSMREYVRLKDILHLGLAWESVKIFSKDKHRSSLAQNIPLLIYLGKILVAINFEN
jgi:hypothetical protein